MSAASSVELSSPLSFCLSHFLSFFISFFLSFFLFFPFLFFRSLFFFSYLPFVSCLFSDYSHTNSCRHRIRITSTQNFALSIRTPKKGRSKVFLLFVNSVFISFSLFISVSQSTLADAFRIYYSTFRGKMTKPEEHKSFTLIF